MERVSLQDRPGLFFVVNRTPFSVRLLDGEREFSVPADLVKVPSSKSVVKRRQYQFSTELSLCTEFVSHLLAHRDHVHIYFSGREGIKQRIYDKYLEITGEELPLRCIITEPESCWLAPKAMIVFPACSPEIKTPSAKHKNICRTYYEHINNVNFAWFLIERHGFRATREYMIEGGKRCAVTP